MSYIVWSKFLIFVNMMTYCIFISTKIGREIDAISRFRSVLKLNYWSKLISWFQKILVATPEQTIECEPKTDSKSEKKLVCSINGQTIDSDDNNEDSQEINHGPWGPIVEYNNEDQVCDYWTINSYYRAKNVSRQSVFCIF